MSLFDLITGADVGQLSTALAAVGANIEGRRAVLSAERKRLEAENAALAAQQPVLLPSESELMRDFHRYKLKAVAD